jgi:hypothetical protein
MVFGGWCPTVVVPVVRHDGAAPAGWQVHLNTQCHAIDEANTINMQGFRWISVHDSLFRTSMVGSLADSPA